MTGSIPGFKLTVCLLFLAVVGCTPLPKDIHNLSNGNIFSIGHGGAGVQPFYNYQPHNTIKGFSKALSNENLDGVEMDVQMTSDNQLVLFHDDHIGSKTKCKGIINEYTLSDILSCKPKVDFLNFSGSKFNIITLEQALSELKKIKPNGVFVLDLKLNSKGNMDVYQQDFANELVNVLNKTNTKKNVCIESMQLDMLEKIKKIDSTLHLFLYVTDFKDGIERASKTKMYGLTVKYSLVSKQDVSEAHNKGLKVSLWGPRTPGANSKAINLQPDYIQTDKLSDLTSKLKKYKFLE